jgi:hypothetical protein
VHVSIKQIEAPVKKSRSSVIEFGLNMTESDSTLMAHTFAKTIAKIAEFAVELAETLHKDLGLEYHGPVTSKGKLTGKKRNRVEKDPNEPKRPPTAYVLYSSHIRDELKRKGEAQLQLKELGEMWNKLDESEKEKYNQEAQKLKDQYDKQMIEYKEGKSSASNGLGPKTDEYSDSGSEDNGDVAPPSKVLH